MDTRTNCFRCGQVAFAILEIEAMVGETRLKISREAEQTGICAPCMIELADFFKLRHADHGNGAGGGNEQITMRH
jgi:hypothetical protein